MSAETWKASFPKEWCARMAELEGDAEIGAGLLAVDLAAGALVGIEGQFSDPTASGDET